MYLQLLYLREFSCVIVADNAVVTEEFTKKAADEGLVILESKMPSYETAVKLHELGI
jgi:serine kinase of HPr protein (carbohydrate metabolism regulator)